MSLIPLGFWAASGGAVSAGSFDLLETEILASSQASVTFSSLGDYAADYQHLQIRAATKVLRGTDDFSGYLMTFDSDTSSNYSWHVLTGNGSSVSSSASVSASNIEIGTMGGDATYTFGAQVIDILDPFETTKYTTARVFGGRDSATSRNEVNLYSGSWRNTAAITTLTFTPVSGHGNFAIGTRFSLYGLKASA